MPSECGHYFVQSDAPLLAGGRPDTMNKVAPNTRQDRSLTSYAKELKSLEDENARLKRLLADAESEKHARTFIA